MTAVVTARHPTELAMLMMVAATVTIPAVDAIAKVLGQTLSPAQIVWLRFLVQLVILVPLARGRWRLVAGADLGLHLVRGVLLVAATLAFFTALIVLPIADAVAIFFVQPLLLSLMAGIVLREGIGWRRLTAVGIGLVGVVLVVRPGFAAFGVYALLPLAAGLLFATYLLLTRLLGARSDAVTLQLTAGVSGFVLMSLALPLGMLAGLPLFAWQPPDAQAWALIVLMGIIGTAVHLVIVQAFRLASATILAPFQYLEIGGAVFWGYLIFGDWPAPLTWLGMAIIVGCGLYVFQRERRLALAPAPPP